MDAMKIAIMKRRSKGNPTELMNEIGEGDEDAKEDLEKQMGLAPQSMQAKEEAAEQAMSQMEESDEDKIEDKMGDVEDEPMDMPMRGAGMRAELDEIKNGEESPEATLAFLKDMLNEDEIGKPGLRGKVAQGLSQRIKGLMKKSV